MPEWLEKESVVLLHDRSLALHGGAAGLRDEGLLESALARPINRNIYEGVEDLVDLAATYAAAISSNHPFVDGNKRSAFLAMTLFLDINGLALMADRVDATLTTFKLAAGELTINALSAWIRTNLG